MGRTVILWQHRGPAGQLRGQNLEEKHILSVCNLEEKHKIGVYDIEEKHILCYN